MTHNVFRIVNERKSNQFLKKNEREEWATDPSRNSVFLNEVAIAKIVKFTIAKGIFEYSELGCGNNNQRKRVLATLISKSVFPRIGNVKKTISVLVLGIQFTHCPTKYTVLLIWSTIKIYSMSRFLLTQESDSFNSKKFKNWPWLWHHFVNE